MKIISIREKKNISSQQTEDQTWETILSLSRSGPVKNHSNNKNRKSKTEEEDVGIIASQEPMKGEQWLSEMSFYRFQIKTLRRIEGFREISSRCGQRRKTLEEDLYITLIQGFGTLLFAILKRMGKLHGRVDFFLCYYSGHDFSQMSQLGWTWMGQCLGPLWILILKKFLPKQKTRGLYVRSSSIMGE